MYEDITYEEFLEIIKADIPPEKVADARNKCPVTPVLNMLQGKWKNHVLFELCKYNTLRFGELKKELPEITNTMLTSTLRELESYGLITRVQFNEIPPHVEYSLTEKGKDLMPLFYVTYKWGMKYNI